MSQFKILIKTFCDVQVVVFSKQKNAVLQINVWFIIWCIQVLFTYCDDVPVLRTCSIGVHLQGSDRTCSVFGQFLCQKPSDLSRIRRQPEFCFPVCQTQRWRL